VNERRPFGLKRLPNFFQIFIPAKNLNIFTKYVTYGTVFFEAFIKRDNLSKSRVLKTPEPSALSRVPVRR
jgi:hypothetical protein